MRRSIRFAFLLLPAVLAGTMNAQTSGAPPAAELQSAAAAFSAGRWADANMQYESLAKRFPQHPLSRFRLGVTLTELGRAAEGEVALREGERLGVPAPQAAYRLAESLAEQKKLDAAIAELRRSAAAGFFVPNATLTGNPHFARLVTHAGWQGALDAFDAIVQPCKHDTRFREFDFWVGDWDVRPTGAPAVGPASRNRITLEESSCVVMEHWEGLGGSTGQSFNLFDRSMGKWRQTWVDNTAGQHEYAGSLVDGNMVMEGTTPAASGQLGRVPTRLTLFHISKDSVRQLFQTSPDSGRTWTPTTDLMYVRRKP
ncbi:MAG: tetratricopeptide repeat protein [Gemmatimonadota bacterium]